MTDIRTAGVASLLILGASLAVAARILALCGRRGSAERVLRYTAFVVLAVGLLGACLLAATWLGLLAWPVVMIIWLRAAINYRATQKQNLLSALALAISKGMPPATMALAFANEQEGSFAARARELAKRFEKGEPIVTVLSRSRRALPPESGLAAEIGLQTGDLAAALDAMTYASVFERTWLQPTISRLLYLAGMSVFFIAMLVFLDTRIVPSWNAIFSDFDYPVASPVSLSVDWSTPPSLPNAVLDWLALNAPWGLMGPLFGLGWITSITLLGGLTILLILVYCWLQWRGTLMPRLPGLRRMIHWVDVAPVLRLLALAVHRDRPVRGVLLALARRHPKRTMRRRARRVVRDLDNGMPWVDSFRRHRLVGNSDAAILNAAGYSRNLGWALGELADSFERTASYRLQVVAQTVVPLLFLPMGVIIAVVAMSYFEPMSALIEHLS